MQIVDLNRKQDIWIYELASGIPTRFSFDPTAASDPIWSSDGSSLYFASDRRDQWDLFRKPSNGASTEELLLGDSATKYPESVSPDGKLLLYSRRDDKTGYDLWVLPLAQAQAAGKPEPRLFLQAPSNQTVSQFSPDGHWVAYQSEESGHYEVYVAPFPGPGGKRQISYGGGVLPRWRRDSKELFYVTDGKLMAAEVTITGGTLQVGRGQKLFDVMNTRGYDVSADGQKFVMTEDPVTSSEPPLTLLQNWPAALRK